MACKDHLAGSLGAALTDVLIRRRFLAVADDSFSVTPEGERFFCELGIDLDALHARNRSVCAACLDWTERRAHLAGSLGTALFEAFLERRWVVRSTDRALRVTDEGERSLQSLLAAQLA